MWPTPGKKIRAPKEYCFEISDPPGTETLFVVLSRSPRDFFELYDAIKAPAHLVRQPAPKPPRRRPDGRRAAR